MQCRCVICREYTDVTNVAALRCGHTFHGACITKWLETRRCCPTCRKVTIQADFVPRLYFDSRENPSNNFTATSNQLQVRQLQEKIRSLTAELNKANSQKRMFAKSHEMVEKMRREIMAKSAESGTIKREALRLKKENHEVMRENAKLRSQLKDSNTKLRRFSIGENAWPRSNDNRTSDTPRGRALVNMRYADNKDNLNVSAAAPMFLPVTPFMVGHFGFGGMAPPPATSRTRPFPTSQQSRRILMFES